MEDKNLKTENKKLHFDPITKQTEEIAKVIIDAAYQVHSTLGPGLLESVYEACMVRELNLRNIEVKSQLVLPVFYKGIEVDSSYRIDILVDDNIIVEIRATEQINPLHCAQLLTYLRLTQKRLGLLFNFNVIHLRDGIKRIIN